MQQLTQKLGSGEMVIQDVPYPQVGNGMIIVKNHYSIISAGTEGSTVQAARKSLIGKAKERPQQVKQVIDVLKKQGVVQTYRAVSKKLDAYSPLGYSCAGEVIEVGAGVNEFQVGDLVACAGAGYANHAEIVAVPENLAVKLHKNADLKKAAYNTLGAISMQGVRQADLRLGESCVIVGLGLLGQLAGLILKASGVTVIGVDISEGAVSSALKNESIDTGWGRNTGGIEEKIKEATNGQGADCVIIAAATSSLDPINFAGAISRKKGKVVVLGAVPTGFDRDPYFYRKELEVKMACSYGPGRYDLNYEEKGIDYPYAYVRWTQKRNMEAFQNLIQKNQINIDFLSTHEFEFEKAKDAFDLVVSKSEPFIGIALKYDCSKPALKESLKTNELKSDSQVKVSFIGAGSYAQGNLLPNLPKSKVSLTGVMTNSGTTSKRVAEKFGFAFCTPNEKDVLDERTNTLFIATRHDSHGEYVLKGLKSNKHIFVEKPLCLKVEELNEIEKFSNASNTHLLVGFNRRFSPFTQKIKNKVKGAPLTLIYRVNAGQIPADNWIQDTEIGGGRILGEVCHFIDYARYMADSPIKRISANALNNPNNIQDTLNVLIQFENGSSAIIGYYANGSKSLEKEYVEVFSQGQTFILKDFKMMQEYGKGKPTKHKTFGQQKGQKEMVEAFVNGITNEGAAAIPKEEIFEVMRATFAVIESLSKNGKQIEI